MSSFDDPKLYYVFKYVVDPVSGESVEYEGEIQSFVKATDPWNAVEKAGFTSMNDYGANRIEDLSKFEKAIADERKHLSKISKQLKEFTDEEKKEREKFYEERLCPNCKIKMNEKWQCDKCGFGKEKEQLIGDIEKTIADEKAKGNDTTELEAIRDAINKSFED